MGFAHLHLHTEYSLLDGANRIKDLAKRLKSLGFTHAAITDHGVLYGAIEFYKALKQEGLTPIIGCEVYICKDRFAKTGDTRSASHLILLCKNNTGYHNLLKLVSAGYVEGYYYRPRIDYSLLEKYSEGLICLSGCLSGDLQKLLLQGRYDDAKAYVKYMQGIFGEDYYIEIMDHGITEERMVLKQLISLSKETQIPLVATNDCHYLKQEDAAAQEVLLCIQTGKTLNEEKRMHMQTDQLFLKSESQMRALFSEVPQAVDNTMEIAKRCNVNLDFNTIHLPKYEIKTNESPIEMLTRLCKEGLKQRYPSEYNNENSQPYKRLKYEIDMINKMGYVDYFLIVWDFINFAKNKGILVGPGRGSGAGSIVAYTLSITMLDPIKYQLLFERFLNPERMSMPDLDIDFCYERRQEVIDYVTAKYGQDHVAQIITFGTMKAKAVIRDVGRVLGLSYSLVDSVAKAIPFALDMTLEKAMQVSPQLKEMVDTDAQIKQLYNMALTLEGMPRHASTHAAGVLITAKPITEYVPLQLNDQVVTTQYPMGTLEQLGLLKMDFLGLRTLTVIKDTISILNQLGNPIKLEDINLEDSAVYKMISKGDTDGVFQLESGGMRQFLANMKPSCFEDVIAAISLYRPGPMDSIPRYIKGKADASTVKYLSPMLKPILEVTYGCMVYQEQVMQIVRDLGGYSLGRSDLMRRAMSKKKKEVMEEERRYFVEGMVDEQGNILIEGAVRRGVSKEIAEQIFDEMSTFASYAFNKSHAAAYAMLAVQTAWLKKYYPVVFMAAMLNSVMDNTPKVANYIQYCRLHNIIVLPPNVNTSDWRFSVETNKDNQQCIRFALSAIKNVGHQAMESLIIQRKSGKFTSLQQFIERMGNSLNKRSLESLIKAGALDDFKENRAQMLCVFEQQMDAFSKKRKDNVMGQVSLFDLNVGLEVDTPIPEIQQVKEHDLRILLNMEKEMTGVYISGHPLDEVKEWIGKEYTTVADVINWTEDNPQQEKHVKMAGIIVMSKSKVTKKGGVMAIVNLEDMTGQIEGIVFPRVYDKYQFLLAEDAYVVLEGRVSSKEEEETRIIVDTVAPLKAPKVSEKPKETPKIKLTDAQLAKIAEKKLYIKIPSYKDLQILKERCVAKHGSIPIYVKVEKENIALLLDKKYWTNDSNEELQQFIAYYGKENVVKK